MALSALRSLSDAVDLTRALLLPLSPRRWGALAAVVAFLGPAGTPLPASPQLVDPRLWETLPAARTVSRYGLALLPDPVVPSVAVGVAVLGVLFVGYLAAGSLMHYVLVERLRQPRIPVRVAGRRHRRRALGLAVFRGAVWSVGFAAAGAVVLGVLGIRGTGDPSTATLVGAGVVVALVWAVDAATCQLAVPVSVAADVGVLAAWRRLGAVVRTHPTEYLVYAVVRPVVSVAVGVLAALAVGAGAGAVAVLLGTLAGATVLLGGLTTASWLVVAALGGIGTIVALAVAAVVSVPFHAYLQYYALLVIGATAPAFDLVAEQRARARGDQPGEPV